MINSQVHLRSSASIAGDNVNRLYKRRLGQLPRERVLTTAIANEEDTQLGGRHGECEMYEIIGGRRGNTKDYVVPRSSKSLVLVGVDSSISKNLCGGAEKYIFACMCDSR